MKYYFNRFVISQYLLTFILLDGIIICVNKTITQRSKDTIMSCEVKTSFLENKWIPMRENLKEIQSLLKRSEMAELMIEEESPEIQNVLNSIRNTNFDN